MIIKSISTQTSRTFEVPGQNGRQKYIKVVTGATAELLDDENPKDAYHELSNFVKQNISYELKQLQTKQASRVEDKGGDLRSQLLG